MIDRLSPPAFKKSLDFKLPLPEKIHSKGEVEVWHLPSSVSEAVKIEIIFKAGKYYENNIGEAHFALNLLDKGTSKNNATEIANTLDYYGAHLDAKVGFDFSTIALYSLKKNLEKLLPVLFSVLNSPTFPESEFELLRKIVVENLKVNLEKNEFISSNYIRNQLYGDHPYGMDTKISDISRINLDQLKDFYFKNLYPFKILIVGNVDAKTVSTIISNLNLSNSTIHSTIQIPDYNIKTEIIEGPSKVQASIRLGKRTINRTHNDWPTVQLINHILGGYFGSRLMKNIREEKGLTYGIHSSVNPFQHSTWIGIAAEVNNENVDLVLKEIESELRGLTEISDEELTIGKNHFIGSLQNDIATIFATGERIKTIILNNLPSDFYLKLIEKVNSIDQSTFQKSSIEFFSPNQFSSVAVK